ncbi:MAG: serine/threonine protein kinase [Candidatus Methanoperedens sp.]|nr:serine/threonine protein kinase [Candidatus Methanoperedens sp.]MCZ7370909.1 serine/threonine protein kinase [Candidatus Methanoperedens sp.]
MLENIPETFLSTSNKEFRVLIAIENKMKFYEWVPLDEIVKFTTFDVKEVGFILSNLAEKKLVHKNIPGYEGYRIYFEAYDLLALKALVSRGSVNAIGDVAGVGKESRVYSATSGITNREVVIKFHREGMMSFKQVKVKRGHLSGKKHLSWLYASRLAAKREYDALKILYPEVSVPEPIDNNRHAIVMSIAEGRILAHTKVDEPEWYLDEILTAVKKTARLGIVHGDLSEFNVFVNPYGCEIIDWPQYITLSHPNAKEMLYRDIDNVLTFFAKKYRVKRDIQGVINSIIEIWPKK